VKAICLPSSEGVRTHIYVIRIRDIDEAKVPRGGMVRGYLQKLIARFTASRSKYHDGLSALKGKVHVLVVRVCGDVRCFAADGQTFVEREKRRG
jgi:hypothetical protein